MTLKEDKFVKESFEFIKEYFKQSLDELRIDPEKETAIFIPNSRRFLGKIYTNGDLEDQCLIWMRRTGDNETICFNSGLDIDINSTEVCQEIIIPELVGDNVYFAPTKVIGKSVQGIYPNRLDKKASFSFLWNRFTRHKVMLLFQLDG